MSRSETYLHDFHRILLRAVLLYFSVLVIPLTVAVAIYAARIGDVRETLLSSTEQRLFLSESTVEASIRNISSVVTGVVREQEINAILDVEEPVTSQAMLRFARVHQNSAISQHTEPTILDMVLYFRRSDVLFTSEYVFFNPARFYGTFFREQQQGYEQWMSELADGSHHRQDIRFAQVRIKDETKRVLVRVDSLPNRPHLTNAAKLVTLIDRGAIEELILNQLVPRQGFAYIVMPGGRVFSEVHTGHYETVPIRSDLRGTGMRQSRVNGTPHLIYHVRSDYNDWLYVVGAPRSVFLAPVRAVHTLFIIMGTIFVGVGFPLAFLLARRLSLPVAQIVEILERKNPVGTASTVQTLSYISDSVRRLVNDNTDLRTLVEKERPFITRMVTERIFRGDYVHSEDLHAFLEAHGIELRASFYGVGCLLLEGYYDETDPAMIERYMVEGAIVRDAMNALLPTSSLLHQLSLNRIAFVLAIKGVEDRHEAESRFERIVEETARTLSKRDHYRFMMAGGPVVTSLTNVGVALRPALERLIDAHPVTSGYVGYWAESGNAKAYYYPQDLETKLIDIVLRGETDEVRDIVQSLMEENFRRRSLSVRLLKSFVHELEGTRTKIAEQLGVFPREDATGENAKKDSWEAEVRARLDWLVEAAQMRCPENGRRNHRLYKPLANYIESHFTEPSLSLKLIASEFGVSEVYMSTLFHELFGKTFFAYVEEKRMEHAGALLKSGKHSVKDVGKRVGFQTPAGFSRAFQRYYSVQPSKYR